MAEYVSRGGELVFPPPYIAQDVVLYGFILPADQGKLGEICDKYLNKPSGGAVNFRPIVPYAILVFDKMQKLRCSAPPFDEMGWSSEDESMIWVPVEDVNTGSIRFFVPYAFINNEYSMLAGREVYGFPKDMARLQISDNPQDATLFTLETTVIPKFSASETRDYSPETKACLREVISVVQTKKHEGIITEISDMVQLTESFFHMLGEQTGIVQDYEVLKGLFKDIMSMSVPYVLLKQFRDVEHCDEACYQAIVELSIKQTSFLGANLMSGKYEAIITSYPSHPIKEELGFASNNLQSVLSFWVKMDFELQRGKEIWKA